MIQMRLRQAQEGFFDREKVLKRVDARTARALARFGAYTMKVDQRSQRRRKKGTAPAGQPPFAHSDNGIRDNTLFVYEETFASKSVIIGPILFNRSNPNMLRVMEEGGTLTRTRKGKAITRTYAPHPHTGPAFSKALDKLGTLFSA